jgi:hypothetical protein
MDKNEIKKLLYKGDYYAKLDYIRKGIAYYALKELLVAFQIPVSDMGEADFFPSMEAKLLIRWL